MSLIASLGLRGSRISWTRIIGRNLIIWTRRTISSSCCSRNSCVRRGIGIIRRFLAIISSCLSRWWIIWSLLCVISGNSWGRLLLGVISIWRLLCIFCGRFLLCTISGWLLLCIFSSRRFIIGISGGLALLLLVRVLFYIRLGGSTCFSIRFSGVISINLWLLFGRVESFVRDSISVLDLLEFNSVA